MNQSAEHKIISSVLPNKRIIGFVLLLFVLIFAIVGSILFFILGENVIPEGAFPAIMGWTPKTAGALILFFGGAILSLFVLIWLIIYSINTIKETNIKKLLRNGQLKEGVVVSNIQNFYVKVNDVPQRVVRFKADNEVYEYRFFSEEWATYFPTGTTLKIRCSKKGTALPDPSFWVS